MPPSIIDELRNKYSKFRDRHDEAWLQAKRDEDKAAVKKMLRTWSLARTPTQEYWRRERLKNKSRFVRLKEQGKAGLTDEVLAGIGEVMEKNLKIGGRNLSTPPSPPTTIHAAAVEGGGGSGGDARPQA